MNQNTDASCHFMQAALEQAVKAAALGEVPVGAVVVLDGEIIARAHNQVESGCDATLHAEILALRRAAEQLSDWRLTGAALYVTLEPCPMCIGAMLLSRISTLHFASADPAQGAVGSVFDISNHPALPHQIEVYSGALAEQSQALLKDFFGKLRK